MKSFVTKKLVVASILATLLFVVVAPHFRRASRRFHEVKRVNAASATMFFFTNCTLGNEGLIGFGASHIDPTQCVGATLDIQISNAVSVCGTTVPCNVDIPAGTYTLGNTASTYLTFTNYCPHISGEGMGVTILNVPYVHGTTGGGPFVFNV